MNEPNFRAIRFIQPTILGSVLRPPALSPQPSYYADANGISAKLKQVNWFTSLSPLYKLKKRLDVNGKIQFCGANFSSFL